MRARLARGLRRLAHRLDGTPTVVHVHIDEITLGRAIDRASRKYRRSMGQSGD